MRGAADAEEAEGDEQMTTVFVHGGGRCAAEQPFQGDAERDRVCGGPFAREDLPGLPAEDLSGQVPDVALSEPAAASSRRAISVLLHLRASRSD